MKPDWIDSNDMISEGVFFKTFQCFRRYDSRKWRYGKCPDLYLYLYLRQGGGYAITLLCLSSIVFLNFSMSVFLFFCMLFSCLI